jgi:diadenosine tetraphosphate (Ap4A) HIT family hydrolase
MKPTYLAALCLLGVFRVAAADPAPAPPADKPAAPAAATDDHAQWRHLRAAREKQVHDKGERFARIAVKQDYTGEYVVYRDKDVTAFLDLKDPQHPRYKRGHDDDDGIDPKKLAHILVVPNEPRETIGKTISSDITADDLEVTLKVMKAAETVATKLGIKNAKIYVKSPARVGVGYLHVHVVGERDPNTAYPPPLKP